LAPLLMLALLAFKPAWWPALLGQACWRMVLRFVPGLQRRQDRTAHAMGQAAP
jgi:hypothetical protein